MNKSLWLLMVGIIFFTSCSRQLSNFMKKKENLEVIDPSFSDLSAKAKFKYSHNGNKVSASANFRIKNDSLIWMSISPALGIELARVLIDRENIRVIDKIKKSYYEYSFEELSLKYGFDFNYDMVQSVLLGNLIEPYKDQQVAKSEQYYTYTASKDGYRFSNYVGTRSMKLERLDVSNPHSKNTISVTYSNFALVDGQIFPSSISAIINYEEEKPETSIDIAYNKMVIEELPISFPFSVPNKYERR